MADQPIPIYAVAVRPCTLHSGRFRWDIHHLGVPVLSSPDSYVSEIEAFRAGASEALRLQSGDDKP
jgi:hypothetical protein